MLRDADGVGEDEVSWGDAGALQHIVARLREICDSVFREGDYAD